MPLTTLPHISTFILWSLLVPGSVFMIAVAPAQVRFTLCLDLGRFLFLSFLLFYLWGDTKGYNEPLIDVLVRLYMAVSASVGAFTIEHWHLLSKSASPPAKPSMQQQQGESAASKLVPVAPSKTGRNKHLAFTLTLLLFYWAWLIYGVTQLHLR